jgi:ribosomal protein S18 acetylase RimI-like enzyme
MTELLIRKPKADEVDSVRVVVQTVVDEIYGGLWASSPLPVDEDDWSVALVAIVDKCIVGMVLTHEEWVGDLWVLRESRGRGIGRKLLEMGEAEIVGRGYEVFRLRVVKSNASAVNFYLQNGWKVKREFHHEKLPITMLEMMKLASR